LLIRDFRHTLLFRRPDLRGFPILNANNQNAK
jgi:hypothetical protein